MKRIDKSTAPERVGTGYPAPFDVPCRDRRRRRLAQAAGLTQFGVNQLRLPPGVWSSQRHWHTHDHFQNRSDRDAVLLEIGTAHPDDDVCEYPDIDMVSDPAVGYRRRDGTPY